MAKEVMDVMKMTKVQLVDYFESLVKEKELEIMRLTQLVDSLSGGGGSKTTIHKSKPVVFDS